MFFRLRFYHVIPVALFVPGTVLALELERNLIDITPAVQASKPVFMSADKVSGRPEVELNLQGNAEVRRSGTTVQGDRITYYTADDEVVAVGNVSVKRQGNQFNGPLLQLKVDSNIGYFERPNYLLGLYRGSGTADRINFLGEKKMSMVNASFTTCEPDSPAWRLIAKNLEIDEITQTGRAEGATLVFGDTGVVSLPFLPFAIGDGRKSGFLSPSMSVSSRAGVEVVTPYYFNLAPNRDLVVAPHVSLRRGVSFNNTFRYLERPMFGDIKFDWNPKDATTGTQRFHLNSTNKIVNWFGWGGALNLRFVSDDTYLPTYAREILDSAQTKLPRELVLNRGVFEGWNANVTVRAYQNILSARDSLVETPFNQLPRLGLGREYFLPNGFEYNQQFEVAHFSRHVANTAEGWRAVSTSSLRRPVQNQGAFFIPKIDFSLSQYSLDANPITANDIAKGITQKPLNFNRALPVLSLDSGLIFDRPVTWRSRAATQTLEPRIFYAWAPYRDQALIPVFDSAAASFGFPQLFSEYPYLGKDRIADVNQVSVGLSTRVIETDGQESLRASIGQKFYFSDQRVGLPTGEPIAGGKSDVLMSLGSSLTKSLSVDAYGQYVTDRQKLSRVSFNLAYRPDAQRLLGIGMRYLKDPRDLSNQLSQVDASWRWPISARWSSLGRINYSLLHGVTLAGSTTEERPGILEALLGAELDWDCWTWRFVAHRYVASDKKPNTKLLLQVELKGLGRLGSNPFDILRRNIPGYQLSNERPTSPGTYFGYE